MHDLPTRLLQVSIAAPTLLIAAAIARDAHARGMARIRADRERGR